MNFVIRQFGGRITSRLDTTINRQNIDYYVPDGVRELLWSPAIYIRLKKSGKAVASQFAPRYYEALSFGALFYPDGSDVCDYTTLLPMPLFNMQTLLGEGNRFSVKLDGNVLFDLPVEDIRDKVDCIIEDCSINTAVRLGDYVAAELQPQSPLLNSGKTAARLQLSYCDCATADIEIKF